MWRQSEFDQGAAFPLRRGPAGRTRPLKISLSDIYRGGSNNVDWRACPWKGIVRAKRPRQLKMLERLQVAKLCQLLRRFARGGYSCAGAGAAAFVGGETSVAGVKCAWRAPFV